MRPTRRERWLLRAVPGDRRQDIAGDLYEEAAAIARREGERAARRWVRGQLGGFVRQRVRAALAVAWVVPAIDPRSWWSITDARVGLRLALREPVATLTAVLALGAAIGIAISGYTVVREAILADLPIDGGDRVYQVEMRLEGRRAGPDPAEVAAWLEMPRERAIVGAFQSLNTPIAFAGATPVTVSTGRVTPVAFAAIAPAPVLGRHLTDADARPGAEPAVVISERLWREHLGAATGAIGARIEVAGQTRTLVGVLPDGWGFPTQQRAWLPLATGADGAAASRSTSVWAMLPQGASPARLAAEMAALAIAAGPTDRPDPAIRLVPYTRSFASDGFDVFMALLMTFLLALLAVVSLNVANLVLARTARRSEEIAVRTALGGSRARICVQLFVEVLVMGVCGGALGLVGSRFAVRWLEAQVGDEWPFWVDFSISPSVFGWTLLLAVLASALASLVPALRATGAIASTLQAGGSRTAPAAMGRLASALLAVELAASLALLVVAVLLGQALLAYQRPPGAYDGTRVLTASLYRDPSLVRDADASTDLGVLRARLQRELGALPGVRAAGLAMSLPRLHDNVDPFAIEGLGDRGPGTAHAGYVVPGFFAALGVSALQGRTFRDDDISEVGTRVAVVSRGFVQRHLEGRWAPGLRIREVLDRERFPDREEPPWLEIVGVVPDLGLDPGDEVNVGEVYRIVSGSNFYYAALLVDGDPLTYASALRDTVAAVDPAFRVAEVLPLSEVGWEARALLGGAGSALALLGTMALLLSLAGLYALASVAVTARTREIGVRIALGATPAAILRNVLARSVRQLVAGAILGALLTAMLVRATAVLPFAVPTAFAGTLGALVAVMVLAGMLASWTPARRALRIEPMEALRGD